MSYQVTLEHLRELHLAAVRAARSAELAAANFNQALATYLVERDVAPGLTVDIHGDGKLREPQMCTPYIGKE
jgi:hypothetical protein